MSFWKSLFGISQKEAWAQLAEQLGAQMKGGTWREALNVSARVGEFDILLDTYTVSTGKSSTTYTRLRAPFVNPTGLRLALHRTHFFSAIERAFGGQDIEIGVQDFDQAFVISGNDEAGVRRVLQDPSLRALIFAQPRIKLEVADHEGLFGPKYGEGVDLLRFIEVGVIRDVERLRGLFALFGALLHALTGRADADVLAVPNARIPGAFADTLDNVFESLGGRCERVGDAFEARLPDPLGLATDARALLAIPVLPSLKTTLAFDAGLPAGSDTLHIEKRGLLGFGHGETGNAVIDDKLSITGDAKLAQRLLRPLELLAAYAPVITASAEHLTVSVETMDAHHAPRVVGATLDLWQELCRARAGVG
jgi:hypothetical protein